ESSAAAHRLMRADTLAPGTGRIALRSLLLPQQVIHHPAPMDFLRFRPIALRKPGLPLRTDGVARLLFGGLRAFLAGSADLIEEAQWTGHRVRRHLYR